MNETGAETGREPVNATSSETRRSRRWFLGRTTATSAAVVSVAGCGTPMSTDGSGRLEVQISNERSDPESVTVRVLDSGGSVVDDAEYEVDPGVSRSHAFEGPSDERYRAMMIGGGWRTNADWDATACRDFLARTRLSGDESEPETALSAEC